MFAVSQDLCK